MPKLHCRGHSQLTVLTCFEKNLCSSTNNWCFEGGYNSTNNSLIKPCTEPVTLSSQVPMVFWTLCPHSLNLCSCVVVFIHIEKRLLANDTAHLLTNIHDSDVSRNTILRWVFPAFVLYQFSVTQQHYQDSGPSFSFHSSNKRAFVSVWVLLIKHGVRVTI
jgi:hypothetical protein